MGQNEKVQIPWCFAPPLGMPPEGWKPQLKTKGEKIRKRPLSSQTAYQGEGWQEGWSGIRNKSFAAASSAKKGTETSLSPPEVLHAI